MADSRARPDTGPQSPGGTVPFPGITVVLGIVVLASAKKHNYSASAIVSHRRLIARTRARRCFQGPRRTVPFPSVAFVTAGITSTEQHHDVTGAVVSHGVVLPGTRAVSRSQI